MNSLSPVLRLNTQAFSNRFELSRGAGGTKMARKISRMMMRRCCLLIIVSVRADLAVELKVTTLRA
jgi:hypothetical protein